MMTMMVAIMVMVLIIVINKKETVTITRVLVEGLVDEHNFNTNTVIIKYRYT